MILRKTSFQETKKQQLIHKKQGFTLVELLVVIVIIGILTAIMAPSFFNFSRKNKLTQSVQILRTMLAEGFSSSRSKSKIYSITILPQKVTITSYSYKNCCTAVDACNFTTPSCQASAQNIASKDFVGTVKVIDPSTAFDVNFIPPHGDIYQGSGTQVIKLEDNYGNNRELTIYMKSGLID